MSLVKLYGRFIIVYLKSKTEYGIYYFMDFVMNILWGIINLAVVWLILNKFGFIKDWSFYQVMFLYNINYVSYSLSGMVVWAPMREMEDTIRQGAFDGALVKPLNPFLYLVFKQFSHGHLITLGFGLVVFALCIGKIGVVWTLTKIIWLLVVLIGSTLIQAAFMVFMGSLNFWFLKSSAALDGILYDLRSFLNYPLAIYDKWIQVLLTVILPYGFINFYPSQFFLNKTGGYLFHPILQFGTPVIGVFLFFLAYKFWSFGVNRYQSTGS